MKCLVLTRGNLPSKAANSIHIYNMANALSKNGIDVKLTIDHFFSKEKIHDFYGGDTFDITSCLPLPRFILWRKFTNYLYMRKLKSIIEVWKPDFIFTRDLHLLKNIKTNTSIIWETHADVLSDLQLTLLNRLNIIKVVTITKTQSKMLKRKYGINSEILHDATVKRKILNIEKIRKIFIQF